MMTSEVIIAAVASVVPVATYFLVRYQRSGRTQRSQTVAVQDELKTVHQEIFQLRTEINSVRVDVAALKIRNQVTS